MVVINKLNFYVLVYIVYSSLSNNNYMKKFN